MSDDHPYADRVVSTDTSIVVPLEARLAAELRAAKDDRLWKNAKLWIRKAATRDALQRE